MPADGTFEPDRPPKIGVYGARQIVVFRLEFGDDAERRRDHDRRADRYVDGMLKERGGRVATERATCLRHIGWNGEDLHPANLARHDYLREEGRSVIQIRFRAPVDAAAQSDRSGKRRGLLEHDVLRRRLDVIQRIAAIHRYLEIGPKDIGQADSDIGVAVETEERVHASTEVPLIERLVESMGELHFPGSFGRNVRRGKRQERVAERQGRDRGVTILRVCECSEK